MKVKEQVVSLELAKELKILNVKQDSLWYHVKFEDDSYLDVIGATQFDTIFRLIQRGFFEFEQFDEIYSAYTVAELGELSPHWIDFTQKHYNPAGKLSWYRSYSHEGIMWVDEIKEADARARMLIYCIKHDLIKK